MAVTVVWEQSGALQRRMAEIVGSVKPDSRPVRALRQDIAAAVVLDNEEKLLVRSVDRYGRSFAPLAASTLANKRRGPGPALVPNGERSRFVSTFKIRWNREGDSWKMIAGWVGFVSQRGFPIPLAHMHGVPGRLPRRDPGGVTPKGWGLIRIAFSDFVERLAKSNARGY